MLLKYDYDFLFNYLKNYVSENEKYHKNNSEYIKWLIREFLQTLVLYIIYQSKYEIYFMGGTNMRICYGLDRFSEDLDFATLVPDKKFDIKGIENIIAKECKNAWFDVKVSTVESKTNVKKCFVKFENVVSQFFGIKTNEKISIKLEIDINPPLWAEIEKYVVQNPLFTFVLQHHSLATTFTGKIGAVLLREYNKW
jgi:predicted nucleotidyltransferase component of viral defense system